MTHYPTPNEWANQAIRETAQEYEEDISDEGHGEIIEVTEGERQVLYLTYDFKNYYKFTVTPVTPESVKDATILHNSRVIYSSHDERIEKMLEMAIKPLSELDHRIIYEANVFQARDGDMQTLCPVCLESVLKPGITEPDSEGEGYLDDTLLYDTPTWCLVIHWDCQDHAMEMGAVPSAHGALRN